MGHVKRQSAFEHAHNAQIQIILRMRKSIIWVFALNLKHSVLYNDSVSGQWRPWSDCAAAQADLGLCCPRMPQDTFSLGTAQ